MRPHTGIRVATLVLAGLLTTALAWVGLRLLGSVGNVADPPWIGVAVMVFLGGGLLVAGWQVRQYRDGKATQRLSPLRAARTLVLGQAGALTGAVLAGWYVANVLMLLPDSDIDSQRDRIWSLAVHVLVAVVLSTAGMVVQRWCRLPPRGDDENEPGSG